MIKQTKKEHTCKLFPPIDWKTKPWTKDPSLQELESGDLLLDVFVSVLWELNETWALLWLSFLTQPDYFAATGRPACCMLKTVTLNAHSFPWLQQQMRCRPCC